MTAKKGTTTQLIDALQLGVTLRPEQERAIESLEWLYGEESQREGRTTALAVFHIKRAMSNPGVGVVLFDHYVGRAGQQSMERAVLTFLEKASPGVSDSLSVRNGKLTYLSAKGTPKRPRERVDITYRTASNSFDAFPGTRSGRVRSDRPNISLRERQLQNRNNEED